MLGPDRTGCISRLEELEGAILLEMIKIAKASQESVKGNSSVNTKELVDFVVAQTETGYGMYLATDFEVRSTVPPGIGQNARYRHNDRIECNTVVSVWLARRGALPYRCGRWFQGGHATGTCPAPTPRPDTVRCCACSFPRRCACSFPRRHASGCLRCSKTTQATKRIAIALPRATKRRTVATTCWRL